MKGFFAEIRSDFPMWPGWSVAEYVPDCHLLGGELQPVGISCREVVSSRQFLFFEGKKKHEKESDH